MNTNNITNAEPPPGQPPPLQNGSSNDAVTKGDKPQDICRNFVWGTCNKNKLCKFRHELVFEEMKDILKFCHDYQNPSGCSREHCTYLHTTKEEENLFLTEHILPRVLEERHNAMRMPPPPPPPRPHTAPIRGPAPFVGMASMLNLPNLPPPPPPPPPPPTQPSTSVQPPLTPTYTAPPPQSSSLNLILTQPPPAVPDFNPSVPPPVATNAQENTDAQKRSSLSNDAGASKKRRTEDSIDADTLCEQCLQRDSRIEDFKEEISKLSSQEEYQMLIYKKKLEDYNNKKELLRSLVGSDLFRFVEEYVEGVPHLDVLSQLNQSSFLTGTSSVPKQFLLQLMDYFFGNTRSVETVNHVPSSALRLEELLQSARRPDTNHTPDVLRARLSLFDLLANSGLSPEKLVESEMNKSNKSMVKGAGNGFHRVSNGQKPEGSPPIRGGANGFLQAAACGQPPAPPAAPLAAPPPAAPSPALSPTLSPALATAQPTVYPTYQPTKPPPAKAFPSFATPSQNGTYRMDQPSLLSRATPTPVPNTSKNNCLPFGVGMFPGTFYNQPYQ